MRLGQRSRALIAVAAIAIAGAVALVPSSASAATQIKITFSEFPVGTTITNQYAPQGLIFDGDPAALDDPQVITDDASNNTSPVLSGTPQFQGTVGGYFVVPGRSTTFSHGAAQNAVVNSLTLDTGYINDPGSVIFSVYGLEGALIASTPANTDGIDTLTLTAAGIHSFTVKAVGAEDAGFAIDNVTFNKPALSAWHYVALGDSYSSGEGNSPFVNGTATSSDKCHRSISGAYPDFVNSDAAIGVKTFSFVACSGARRNNIQNGQYGEASQLNAISKSTDLMTVGVGGDDVGFANVIESCITGANGLIGSVHGDADCKDDELPDPSGIGYDTRAQIEEFDIEALGDSTSCGPNSKDCKPSLEYLYQEMASRAAPGARIVVVLYPHLFKTDPGSRGCTLRGAAVLSGTDSAISISQANMLWLNSGVDDLDSEIISQVQLAQDQGVNITYVDPRDDFDDNANGQSDGGHGVCTAQPWLNGLELPPNVAFSMHPNSKSKNGGTGGQGAFASEVEGAI